MRTTLLGPADYRPMPWKNGQGTTHEIWVERDAEDAASGGFRFRLSIASVKLAAPFSRFPHCDRTLLLLDGEGMLLDSGPGRQKRLDTRYVPYAFSGDWDTACTLIAGPCRDFNVMVDRRRLRAQVQVLTLRADSPQLLSTQPSDERWALFTLAGTVRLRDETTGPHPLPQTLSPEHTLILSADEAAPCLGDLRLRAESADATLLWIALRPAAGTAA